MSSAPIDFRTAYCLWQGCKPEDFERQVLRRVLFIQARILRALIRPIRPQSFHAESVLIRQAGDKQDLTDIEIDIDFYQHKYVVGRLGRESLRFRVSGRTLTRLARQAFRGAQNG